MHTYACIDALVICDLFIYFIIICVYVLRCGYWCAYVHVFHCFTVAGCFGGPYVRHMQRVTHIEAFMYIDTCV